MSPTRSSNRKCITRLWRCLLLGLFMVFTACSKQHEQQQTAVTPAPPAAPTRLSAIAGDGEVFLTWNSVANAKHYNLYVATTPPLSPQTTLTTANGRKITNATSPFSLDKLDNGITYYFAVTAANDGGEGPASPTASATPTAPQQIPAAPQHLQGRYDHGDITLSWDPVDGARRYTLYLARQAGVSPQSVKNLGGGTSLSDVTSPHTISDLHKNAAYYFVVTAQNDTGESPPSEEIKVAPPAPPALNAPVALKAAVGDGTVALSWSRMAGARSYKVFVARHPEAKAITHFETTHHRYTVHKLQNGATYYFTVTARYAGGESAPSTAVSATPHSLAKPPPAPGGLQAAAGDKHITLSWMASSGAQSYRLYAATARGITPRTVTKLPGGIIINDITSPYTLDHLENGKTFHLLLTAVNQAGESPPSAEITATPQAAPGTPLPPSAGAQAPFLKLDATGRPLTEQRATFERQPWACVKSIQDGLTWEVKQTEPGLHYRSNTYIWRRTGSNAAPARDDTHSCTGSACDTASYVEAVNAQGYCGFHDWRLPTRAELHSLLDRSAVYPAPTINTDYFPNTVNSYYWTATPNPNDERLAWFVYFGSGYEYYDLKSTPFAVRLVRGHR